MSRSSSLNPQKAEFSSVDFSKFKCVICDKYLSVPPIHMCTDPERKGWNICGRCDFPEDPNITHNLGFEQVAKYLEFPCSVHPTCKKKVRFGEAEEHELKCDCREIVCGICGERYLLATVQVHFQLKHKNLLFSEKNLVVREKDICDHRSTNTFLMIKSKDKYLVSTSANRVPLGTNIILSIKVACVSGLPEPLAFDVVFSNDNNTITFKNRQIKRRPKEHDDWINYIFNLSAVKKIFLPDESELTMELQVHRYVENDTGKKTGECRDFDKNSEMLEKLIAELECPICTSVMKDKVVICAKGHSICQKCRDVVNVCQVCRGAFVAQRNVALEDISKKLEGFLV